MRHLFTGMMLLFVVQLYAQNTQTVNSEIKKVTVFSKGAQVVRNGTHPIPAGKTELVFAGISPRIDKQSIQVKGDGDFTIMSVSHRMNYLKQQAVSDEIDQLVKKQADLNEQVTYTNSIINVYRSEQTLIERNQSIGGANNGVTAENLKAMADFQRARLTEIFTKLLELNKKITDLNIEIQKISKQLAQLNNNKEKPTAEIHVMVSSKAAVTGKFEVSYYVNDAGWFANYDLRVESINKPIEIAYKANVFQSSGEDWKNVKLTISNGNPNDNVIAPKLYPWRLHYYAGSANIYQQGNYNYTNNGITSISGRVTDANGEALPGASIMVKGQTLGTITDMDGYYNLQLIPGSNYIVVNYIGYQQQELPVTAAVLNVYLKESVNYLEEVVVTSGSSANLRIQNFLNTPGVTNSEKKEYKTKALETNFEYKATTFNYEIVEPYSVLNDGKIITIDIKTAEVPAEFVYYTAPKIDPAAYLTANVTGWKDLNLVLGEANLFFEGAYLGKSILDPTFASDTLQISLGKDKSVQVLRTKMVEFTQRQFLGGNKIESVAYEIKVRNNKPEPIHIIIKDQLPISAESDIIVEGDVKPAGKIEEETQIVTWDYTIESGKEQKMELKYTVKYPKDRVVILE